VYDYRDCYDEKQTPGGKQQFNNLLHAMRQPAEPKSKRDEYGPCGERYQIAETQTVRYGQHSSASNKKRSAPNECLLQ
jgi:hypothetical protein